MLAGAIGFLVGLILALTGAGGAIVAVPLLIFAFHWNVTQAAPVALLAVGCSAGVGTLLGLRAGTVRYRAAVMMAGSGAIVAPLSVWVAHWLPNKPLTLLFAVTLLYVAQRLYFQALRHLRGEPEPRGQQDQMACRLDPNTGRFRWDARCTRTLGMTGVGTGFLSGLLGVGGGFIIVPALRRCTDLPMDSVVATSLMVVALVSTSAVATSILAGRLNWAVAVPFAGGAIVAMFVGRKLAERVAGPRLQQGFAVIAATVAIGLFVKALY